MNKAHTSNSPFAEVIQSSLTTITAQSWHWDIFPSFGSLLAIHAKDTLIYGIVYQVQTGSCDPNRQAYPFKKTHAELLLEQPQIFELLKTTFDCLIVGYQNQDQIVHTLAPHPPLIHSFISSANTVQAKRFFAHTDYLHVLFNLQHLVFNLDELLIAIFAYQSSHAPLSNEYIAAFMNTYTLLTGNEYKRTKLFLQRIQHSITIG